MAKEPKQDVTDLAKVLAQSSARRGSESTCVGQSPTPAIRPLRILLAEDNPVNQLVVIRLMEKQGHTVTVAANGEQAISAFGRDTFDVSHGHPDAGARRP